MGVKNTKCNDSLILNMLLLENDCNVFDFTACKRLKIGGTIFKYYGSRQNAALYCFKSPTSPYF